jgi:hypothetical protein
MLMQRLRAILLHQIDGHEARLLLERWRAWPYHNTGLLLLGLMFFVTFAKTSFAHEIIEQFQGLSYVGVFVAGVFLPSLFTAAPAVVLLYGFANELNPYLTATVAGAGAMLSDYMIFRFFKDKVFEELQPVLAYFRGTRLAALFRTPYFGWMVPILGMFVIASPLPDEVGLGLLGASRIKPWQFFALAFALNATGILVVVLLARIN